jgi:hypothetical protein
VGAAGSSRAQDDVAARLDDHTLPMGRGTRALPRRFAARHVAIDRRATGLIDRHARFID